ncbi:MAG: ketopantoate reductase family protein [Candidatus Gastranaerophilales bacterium]
MDEIKKVLICGIGAIGSIYADKISRYNHNDLKILVDKSRFEHYNKNPTLFNDKTLDLEYILPDNKDFKADLIIIATKFDGLDKVIKDLSNFIKDDTIILSLLNGVMSEKLIAQTYGAEKLLYSYFIGHSAMREGRKITHDDVNKIVFGTDSELDMTNQELIKKYFEKVGINYEIPDDIIHSIWLKFMLNVSANQTSALLRLTFKEMLDDIKCKKLLEDIMLEVQEIAKAEGVKNTENMISQTFDNLGLMIPNGKTSMLQDIEANRITEVEIFAGTVIELGKKHNIKTPINAMLYTLINIAQDKKS